MSETALERVVRLSRVVVPPYERVSPRTGKREHVDGYSYERHGGAHTAKPGKIIGGLSPRRDMSVTLFNNKSASLENAVNAAGRVFGWDFKDKIGGGTGETARRSIHEQQRAQTVSWLWSMNTQNGFNGDHDQTLAEMLFRQYQDPAYYAEINSVLRTGRRSNNPAVPGLARLQSDIDTMFEAGGYRTEQPMTVFRAMKSDLRDWSRELKPGTVFTDKGIVSTTAHQKFGAGWLMDDVTGRGSRTGSDRDVLLEIRVPPESLVIGGNPEFVETMLPPDTRLKVISSRKRASNAVDPLGSRKSKLSYTNIVAEVV